MNRKISNALIENAVRNANILFYQLIILDKHEKTLNLIKIHNNLVNSGHNNIMSLLLSFVIIGFIQIIVHFHINAFLILILYFYYQGIKYRLKVKTNVKTTVVLIEIV